MLHLALFAGGLFLCNSVPHLVMGLTGEMFYTPWAQPRGRGLSSALENFLWGAANLLVGWLLVEWGDAIATPYGIPTVFCGFLAAGIGISVLFGRRRRKG